jgi:hypothetical protein
MGWSLGKIGRQPLNRGDAGPRAATLLESEHGTVVQAGGRCNDPNLAVLQSGNDLLDGHHKAYSLKKVGEDRKKVYHKLKRWCRMLSMH